MVHGARHKAGPEACSAESGARIECGDSLHVCLLHELVTVTAIGRAQSLHFWFQKLKEFQRIAARNSCIGEESPMLQSRLHVLWCVINDQQLPGTLVNMVFPPARCGATAGRDRGICKGGV
jgi:hypothetical protein